MPVSPEAAARAGLDVLDTLDGRHELAASGTRLAPLGDVVPVPLPLRPEVVSPGDVLVAAGLGQLLVLGMTYGDGGRRPRPAPPVRALIRPATTPAPARPAPARPSRRRSSR
jgi:hypothetical protein